MASLPEEYVYVVVFVPFCLANILVPVAHDTGVSDGRHSAPQVPHHAAVDWDADYWAL